MTRPLAAVTRYLARAPTWVFAVYAAVTSFATYFCMYGYRKPFAAATYDGQMVGALDLKSALVIGQLVGYALSKLGGIKFNSELSHVRRRQALILLIAWAELTLVAFALLPPPGKVLAMFANGLPLGAVWGVVFSFLEGRRVSEVLGAALSCSYIVASGAVKSIGASLMRAGVSEAWMPAATGLAFLVPFVLFAYGLSLLPEPSAADMAARTEREPMDREARRGFLRRYGLGLFGLVIVYLFLTAHRDFRDNYAAEIWVSLGKSGAPEMFTITEIPIAISVMFVLSLLYLVKNNRLGLVGCYAIMIAGTLLIGVSTLLRDAAAISGSTWMMLVGLGLYLAYVPYGCVLFDRTVAALGVVSTAVFLIYVSDAVAYGGSVALVIYKRAAQPELAALDFFRYFSYITSAVTSVLFTACAVYFLRQARAPRDAT